MELMRGTVSALAVAGTLIAAAGSAAAGELGAGPLPAAYHIGPPAPDCRLLAAQHGAQRLWFGAFSGTHNDTFFDIRRPYYAQGCFLSEYDCRRWLHENLSFLEGGSLNWMRCEPGVPARAIY